MAISMNIGPALVDQVNRRITLNWSGGRDFLSIGDGLVQSGHDLPDIAASLFRSYPGSVNIIVIGPTSQPGWNSFTDSNDCLTALIGLLLPAVVQFRAAFVVGKRPASLDLLSSCLSPGGRVLVVSGEGKLL